VATLKNYHIKATRTFSLIRKFGWLITVLVAIGGLWEPKLGLIVAFIMAALIITGFFSGRFWCGNYCPHGSLFDNILPISKNAKIPSFLTSKLMIVGFFIFFMFNFMRRMLNVFQNWGRYDFLDRLGLLFANTYLMVLIVGGLLAVFITPRIWCQFCPMGSMQKLSHKLGKTLGISEKTERKVTISALEKCHSCGKCSRVCPFQLEPFLEFSAVNQFNNVNCIKCSTCVANCPAGVLSLETKNNALKLKEKTSLEGYADRKKITARISAKKELTEEATEYVFSFESPQEVSYRSGQFVLVKIQAKPKSFRAYTISSYNEDSKQLSIVIKKVSGGYGTGKIFSEFKIGDVVELEGPLGNELVLDPSAEKILFIANGIGITPFIAMSKDVLLNYPNAKIIHLLAGQKYEKDLLYHDYFNQLAEQYAKFSYTPILSRDETTSLKKGRVTAGLRNMPDLKGYKVYMCGTKNMLRESYKILLEKGVEKADISYESESKIVL
jgi:NAD(P)H-flavin reductase